MKYYAIIDNTLKKILSIEEGDGPIVIMKKFAKKRNSILDITGCQYSIYEIHRDKIEKIKTKMKEETDLSSLYSYIYIFSSPTMRFSLK